MKMISWIATLLLAALTGSLAVRYLVVAPVQMTLFMVLGLLSLAALIAILAISFKGWQLAGAFLAALIFFAAGWQLTNTRFLSGEEERHLPAITRTAGDPGKGFTAIIYQTHGEPPEYNPQPWIETFKEFDADQATFIPQPFRPFFFYNFRAEYLKMGTSQHNAVHQRTLQLLEQNYRAAGDADTRFYLSFLDSDPRPDEEVIQALNDGASRIILAQVFLTESSHTQAGQEMMDEVNPTQYQVAACSTQPLWDADPLRNLYVERAEQQIQGIDKNKIGVLLVGHGQPDTWDALYPTQTEQENLFREDVAQRFIQAGYRPENVRLAWMEFKQPAVPAVAAELAQNGVEYLLIIPASISASSIHSDIQIPLAIEEAKLPASIQVINLGAWNDDPNLVAAIQQKIAACQNQ